MSFEGLKKLRAWLAHPWRQSDEPLELRQAILEEIESQALVVGGGKKIFPYNKIDIQLLTRNAQERIGLEAVVRDAWDLQQMVNQRMRARGIELPGDLEVIYSFGRLKKTDEERRFNVRYKRVASDNPEDDILTPELRIKIVKGSAKQKAYRLSAQRIFLGRLEEVSDERGRVQRRNDVAFLDEKEDELNRTVSRAHARIDYKPKSGGWFLRDEGSSMGTRIFRTGRSIEVSSRDRRGIRMHTGDEVYLGSASLQISIGAEDSDS